MRFLSADKLFDGQRFLPDNALLVLDENKHLTEITSSEAIEPANIERLEGILTPGFVNAHCHLELSHLKGVIARHTGLPEFARQVIINRNKISAGEQAEHRQDADRAMWDKGIVAVGDISNGPESFKTKTGSRIFYHTFVELIGLNPAVADTVFEKGQALLKELKNSGLAGSLAPHAPYSTSRALIQKIAQQNEALKESFSIHNQESPDESRFFMGEPGGFDKLYAFLGIDTSWFKAPQMASLPYYAEALPSKSPALLVHNTLTVAADIAATAHKQVYWCFCPGANQFIENKLPDYSLFTGLKESICMGTDSLASNAALDVVAEANIILKNTSAFSAEELLRAITLNGAKALGMEDDFGSFLPGKQAGLNLVSLTDSEIRFIKKIA